MIAEPGAIPADDVEAARFLAEACQQLRNEVGKVIVGQKQVVDEVLTAMLCRGHCLVQGVPGLAKTSLVATLSQALMLRFQRIQFTPDLLPSDITGTDILQEDAETRRRRFEFQAGPIFANLILADEINRTPPKTQSALLQAMQEGQVTVGSRTLPLPQPFFVLATQNPIEHEGTYPLPEAQLDRFMFMVLVTYPEYKDELQILRQTTGNETPDVRHVLSAPQLERLQALVSRAPVGLPVYELALRIVRATRPAEEGASDFVRHWIEWGAGPRAGQYMVRAANARALMDGRLHATTDDVLAVAPPVLRHRIIPSFNAVAEGVTIQQIIEKVLSLIPADTGERLL